MTDSADLDVFSGPDGRPTPGERRLVEASARGEVADLSKLPEEDRAVSAALVAALATGHFVHPDWPAWSLPRSGLRVVGAHVKNLLDLENQQVPADLILAHCEFAAGIDLDHAQLNGRLYLGHSRVHGGLRMYAASIARSFEAHEASFDAAGRDAILAVGLKSGSWRLDRAKLVGRLALSGASIDGFCRAAGASFQNPGATAVLAEGLESGPWNLDEARFSGALDLDDAKIAGALRANAAVFEAPGGDAIRARGLEVDDIRLGRAKVNGRCYLSSVRIRYQFSADQATFENPGGVAVDAQEATAVGFFLRDVTVKGRFDVNGVRLGGQFNANGSTFDGSGGDAFVAFSATAGSWFMDGATVIGKCDLTGGRIASGMSLEGAEFRNPGSDALNCQDLHVLSIFMNRARVSGQADFNHAVLEGQWTGEHTIFSNPGGTAISAFSIRARAWLMNHTLVEGELDASWGDFEGPFGGEHAEFRHGGGTAIDARSAVFRKGVYLRDGTEISGGVELAGAVVEQVLDLSGTVCRAARHRAIRLQQAMVAGDVLFRNTVLYGHVHANRARVQGRVDFRGARISASTIARSRGELPAEPGKPANAADVERQERFRDHAIALREARIDGRLVMPDQCPEGIVDLARAQCDTLEDDSRGWPAPLRKESSECEDRLCLDSAEGSGRREIQHLVLDGFEYRFLEFPSGRPDHAADIAQARADWLAAQSVEELRVHFNPQPWLQAASVLRSMGHDEEAQDLAIQRRIRQRLSASTPWFRRLVSWLLHRVADYGFNPWKTVWISVASVLVFAAAYWWLVASCGGFGVWSASPGACNGAPPLVAVQYGDVDPRFVEQGYPEFSPVLYSLDTFVPILDLGSESYWRANTRAYALLRERYWPVGWVLYVLVVLERFIGAILIAIAVTGFTGLLTRDER